MFLNILAFKFYVYYRQRKSYTIIHTISEQSNIDWKMLILNQARSVNIKMTKESDYHFTPVCCRDLVFCVNVSPVTYWGPRCGNTTDARFYQQQWCSQRPVNLGLFLNFSSLSWAFTGLTLNMRWVDLILCLSQYEEILILTSFIKLSDGIWTSNTTESLISCRQRIFIVLRF